MGHNVLLHVPNLTENSSVSRDEQLEYCLHLENLIGDLNIRFSDLISLDVSLWILQPFTADPTNMKIQLQDDLIDL